MEYFGVVHYMKSLVVEIKNILKWRLRNIFIDPVYIIYWHCLPILARIIHFNNNGFPESGRVSGETFPIVITILTYKRPNYLIKTLESFIKMNEMHLDKFLIMTLVQGKDDIETQNIIQRNQHMFQNVLHSEKNLGIAGAYSFLMREALKLDPAYIIHLEDDFLSNEPIYNYLEELISLLVNHDDIGFIRLRSIKDHVNEYNVVSRKKIKYKKFSQNIGVGNANFTFNPTIAKSTVIREIIPVNSEYEAMQKYQRMGLMGGQLFAHGFSHIGHQRVYDWLG